MKTDPVVHFEMPAKDNKRVANFYSKVFGWKMQETSPEMDNYILAMTTESNEKGPIKPGAINGGFYTLTKDMSKEPSVVIAVDDIKASMKKVTNAGGKILGDITDIPGVGKYVSFRDSEGNRVGMLQPRPDTK